MATRGFPMVASACLVALCAVWFAAPALAEDGVTKREVASVKKKIHELQIASERAQDAGRLDEAHELATRARDLTQKLEAFFARRAKAGQHANDKKHPGDKRKRDAKRRTKEQAKAKAKAKHAKAKRAHPEKIIHDLSRAIDALKTLGGHDELIHHLANTIEGIKHREHKKYERRRRGDDERKRDRREREGREEEREDDEERAGLRRRVKVLRLAVPALREGEKRELVRIIERAILTGDLLLEGREDAEARKAMERTPSLPELAEVLHVSAELWRKFGHDKNADQVMWLSRYYRGRSEDREGEEDEEHGERERDERRAHHEREAHERRRHAEREAHERREREEGAHRREAELDELREHLHKLRKQLEDMQRHLKKLSRKR